MTLRQQLRLAQKLLRTNLSMGFQLSREDFPYSIFVVPIHFLRILNPFLSYWESVPHGLIASFAIACLQSLLSIKTLLILLIIIVVLSSDIPSVISDTAHFHIMSAIIAGYSAIYNAKISTYT